MQSAASPSWIVEGKLLAGPYPVTADALAALVGSGVGLCVNLHERALGKERLHGHGLTELHLPVPDFTAPSPETLAQAVAAIDSALAAGHAVAVNCGAGLGRTGTVIAAWLVSQGISAEEAIRLVRARRPGSIETPEQEQAVRECAESFTDG